MVDSPSQVRHAAQAGNLTQFSPADRAGVIRQAKADGVVSYAEVRDLRDAQHALRQQFADAMDGGAASDLASIAHELEVQAGDAHSQRRTGAYSELMSLARQARALVQADQQLTRAIGELESARDEQGTMATIRADVRSFFNLSD